MLWKKGIYGYSHVDNFLKVLLLVFLKVVCEGYQKFSIMEKWRLYVDF